MVVFRGRVFRLGRSLPYRMSASAGETAVRYLVIVPTYNEKENLREIVDRVLEQGPDFNLLVVDDNSPDGTGALAD